MENLAKRKRSSLLRKFITYGCKKVYKIGPWTANSRKWELNQNFAILKKLKVKAGLVAEDSPRNAQIYGSNSGADEGRK